jgi:hypothetical protein
MPDRPLVLTSLAALLAVGGLVAASVTASASASASASATVSVSTSAQLVSALAAAKAGDTIQLADGSYTGKFVTTAAGSSAKPVTLTGSAKAISQNQPDYGEGVYIGSAKSNWSCYAGSSGVDASENVEVLNNRIGPDVAAEGLDIKEGTKNGAVTGNTFDGSGEQNQNSGDSTIDAKGDGYQINGNKVSGPYLDGFQTHTAQSPYGCGNTFADNTFAITASGGYGINVTNNKKCDAGDQNVVYDSNTSSGGKGLTDIAVTPGS